MRKAVIAALLLVSLVFQGNAFAGDVPSLDILGFSEDGGIFAFEEYGIQDGSGFPYARRFYVDTAKDEFVAGTPIRVRLEGEGATLATARAEARRQGEKIVADAVLSRHRGYTAGWNAITEQSANPYVMRVLPRPIFPSPDDPFEVRLEEFSLPADGACMGQGDTKGFRLLRVGTIAGAETEVLHEDASVPQSRHCPLGYRIGGVQTYYPRRGDPVFVVMIAIRGVGFEGPNYDWIAVPGSL
jgi:predicted secreted protein